jgi:hypothetical protein
MTQNMSTSYDRLTSGKNSFSRFFSQAKFFYPCKALNFRATGNSTYLLVLDSWHKSKSHTCHVSVSSHGVYEPEKLGDTQKALNSIFIIFPTVCE